ncbi:MAG: hypothetical protein MJ187_04775 [Alphaproteobacteria bacterium]|nr:hypothetical protein [Alphaproteobacteria bacterium]
MEKMVADNGEKNMGYIKKTKRGGVCLFCGKIEEFCKQTGLKQIDEAIQKSDENWISVTALVEQEISASRQEIANHIENFIANNGDWVYRNTS